MQEASAYLPYMFYGGLYEEVDIIADFTVQTGGHNTAGITVDNDLYKQVVAISGFTVDLALLRSSVCTLYLTF